MFSSAASESFTITNHKNLKMWFYMTAATELRIGAFMPNQNGHFFSDKIFDRQNPNHVGIHRNFLNF